MLGEFPAKFILCRKIVAPPLEGDLSEEALWVEHRRLSRALGDLISDITTGTIDPSKLKDQHPSLLDLKSELVNRMLEHCNFCEWNCRVNRAQGRIGFCKMDKAATVHSYFHHHGEEAPLIGVEGRGGSGTIFFESCNSRCVFCQNWDISQPVAKTSLQGENVTPKRLAEIAEELAHYGAANINYVGGEPTVDLHVIVDSLRYLDRSVPLIWNSNMYCTMETMGILSGVIDLWLPDFKFWRHECAKRLMLIGAKASYPDVARRNHLFAADHGSMIIRHLVMPGHVECCTKPILNFTAQTVGQKVLVNVMAQYRPANLVARAPQKYREIARNPSRDEIQEAYAYARSLNLRFEQVS
jgi:putative pyruvate formate lyase activating enzyme